MRCIGGRQERFADPISLDDAARISVNDGHLVAGHDFKHLVGLQGQQINLSRQDLPLVRAVR